MTLIITALTPNLLVQASDRRLTRSDGKTEDDHANKVVCGVSASGPFVISYSGLAELPSLPNSQRTDEWILDQLTEMKAAERPVEVVVASLSGRLSLVFSQLPPELRMVPTCVGLSGYLVNGTTFKPFLFEIANFSETARRGARFKSRWWALKADADPRKACLVSAIGCESALLGPVRKRLRKLGDRRFFHKENPETIADKLVSIIRIAADAPQAKSKSTGVSVIGKDCLSVWLDPKAGGFQSWFHPKDATAESYGPNLYQGNMSFKRLQMWAGNHDDEIPEWSSFSRKGKGHL